MKKFTFALLAIVLFAGVPAVALELSGINIDLGVDYRARYIYDSNYSRGSSADSDSDSFFNHNLGFDLVFTPIEQISLNWRFEAVQNVRFDSSEDIDIKNKYIYIDLESRFGVFKVGRIDGLDTYGLASLGYAPAWGDFISVGPFEDDGQFDGAGYVREREGYTLKAFYAKVKHNPSLQWDAVGAYRFGSDRDFDRIAGEWARKGHTGGVSVALTVERDMSDNSSGEFPDSDFTIYLNPAFYKTWGDFSLHFEAKGGGGRTVYDSAPATNKFGFAGYIDFDYDYGCGNITLAGWYVSGTMEDVDARSNIVRLGSNFSPLLVAYNGSSMGFNDWTTINDANLNNVGHWAAAVWATHEFTDKISARVAAAYFASTSYTYEYWYPTTVIVDRTIGVELNAGFKIRFLEIVTFETIVGYMFNGDYFKYDQPNFKDRAGTYTWANCLTIEF